MVARLVKTAALPSLIYGSDVTGMAPAQLNEADRPIIFREKTHRRCLDLDHVLEDAGTHPGIRGAMSAILMWQCAWFERWVPALVDDETLLAASVKLRNCLDPWKSVNAPTSAVVASMMRCGWQVLLGTELGTHKRGIELRICASRRVARRASRRLRLMDFGACGDQTSGAGTSAARLSLHHSSLLCSTCARRETLRTERAAVCAHGHDAHVESEVA